MSDSGYGLVYSRVEPEDEAEPDGRIRLVDEEGDEADFWPTWNRASDATTIPAITLANDDAEEMIDSIWQHGIDSLTVVDREFQISVRDSTLIIHNPARKTRTDGGPSGGNSQPDPRNEPRGSASAGYGRLAAVVHPVTPQKPPWSPQRRKPPTPPGSGGSS